MKRRRYRITEAEGELIRLALTHYINDLSEINGPYINWRLEEAILLRDKLNAYEWRSKENVDQK